MDVATQREGPRLTLQQWAEYWEARHPPDASVEAELPAPPAAAPAEDEADSARAGIRRRGGAIGRDQLLLLRELRVAGTPLEVRLACLMWPG